jgi:cobalt-zinc-cadmium efflux system outer membrane protein
MNGWFKTWGFLIAGAACLQSAVVADVPPAFAYVPTTPSPTAEAAPLLTLEEASRLALVDQPVLTGRQATIDAEQQRAVAAAQLPDPKLSGGLKELPIDTPEAFSVRRDNFTEFTVGVSQEFTRAEKRRLKGALQAQGADVDRAALDNDKRAVRRDTSLAWLDVFEAEQAYQLTQRLIDESALQVRALEKDYTAGKASQADWLAAKVEAGLVSDKAHDWLHHSLRARDGLARWIGDASRRPLADSPTLPALSTALPNLVARSDHHPVIGGIDRQIDATTTDIALARQAYKPDVSVELYFAYRPAFSDFVGVQFTVGLPYFTRNRQDRDLGAALHASHAMEERKRDVLRELHAKVSQDFVDWQHFTQRVAEFDSAIIPDAQHRVDAARSAFAAGRGGFDAVLLARRGLLDVQLQRLALSVESARAQVRLEYWTAAQIPTGDPS